MGKTVTERFTLYDDSVVIDFYPTSHRYKLISVDGKEIKAWIPSPSSVVGKLDKSTPLISWAVNMFEERMLEHMRDGAQFTRDDVLSMINLSKNAYNERKQEAADVGSVVHDYAEHNADDITQVEGYNELSERDRVLAQQGVAAFNEWKSVMSPSFIDREFRVYSKRHNFVGKCDGLVEIDGKLYIIDYKTSKGVYTSQVYQIAAYMKAYEEMTGKKVAGAKIVNFTKDDITDKEGNIIRPAGSYMTCTLGRGDLVTAFKAFKGLLDVYRIDYPLSKKISA